MNNIKITADSTCDLSKDLLNKYDISIIPLMITLGDQSLKDGIDINTTSIYEWSDKTKETPKTAAPTIGDAIDFLKPLVVEKKDIIFFGISEIMSTTCNVLRLAAETLGYQRLFVIDSKNLSTGIGLQVIRAAELASKGFSAEEILQDNLQINEKVRASFVIDTLTYLARGGRCSSVTALLANTLKLKPEIIVSDGKMTVAKKYRGNLKAVIIKYVKDREDEIRKSEPTRIFITHSGCPQIIVDEVRDYLINLNHFNEVLITQAGSVVSSHCGPNTLGVLYINS